MKLLRPAGEGDAQKLLALAKTMGTGITTVPADLTTIKRRIEASAVAFDPLAKTNETQDYFMVLEDTESGAVIGTSAIISNIGLTQPFYCYRILKLTQASNQPAMRINTEILQLSNDFSGSAEVASLFLDRDHRKHQNGRLLAKGRYMLMASFPDRFPEKVIAEIRGWVDKDQNSPFWEAIGRHFFGMSFPEADKISGQGNSQFIADLMPKFPIYTSLLSKAARSVIGKPHDGALPALSLLESEGFQFSGAIDIFDAGPAYEAYRTSIETVRCSTAHSLSGIVDGGSHADKATHIVATEDLAGFKAIVTRVAYTDGGVYIPSDAAKTLNVEKGSAIRICGLHDSQKSDIK